MAAKNPYVDHSLRQLAKEITAALKQNQDGSDQKAQVELLMDLEDRFRNNIIKFSQSREVYRAFILLVAVTNRNILSARPYFREKAKTFSARITPAIRDGDIKTLQTFHINYNLIYFIKENWKGPFPKKCDKLYSQILEARRVLIENNMPLVINRAKLFYRKVPRNHLDLMDFINIAALGLVSGVDKWVGAYTRIFNGVCIGRMTGNMIDNYSETTIHFYPSDRSILYRANSLRFKNEVKDINQLTDILNKSYQEDRKNGIRAPKNKITPQELSRLMAAASPVSLETPTTTEDAASSSSFTSTLVDFTEDEVVDSAEEQVINRDLTSKMIGSIRKLPILHQKVLRLKGVKL